MTIWLWCCQLVHEEVLALHGVFELFLVEHIRMALDTVGTALIHEFFGQVNVCLVKLYHIVAWFQIFVLGELILIGNLTLMRLQVFLFMTGAVIRFSGTISFLALLLKFIVAGDSSETSNLCRCSCTQFMIYRLRARRLSTLERWVCIDMARI